jgi:hypothetical protein
LAGVELLLPNRLHAIAGLVVRMQATTVATVAMRFMFGSPVDLANSWLIHGKAQPVPVKEICGC